MEALMGLCLQDCEPDVPQRPSLELAEVLRYWHDSVRSTRYLLFGFVSLS